MRRIVAFIRLSRLHFLALPVLAYLIGAALARQARGSLDDGLLLAGLGIELLVQLSTAYLNDYWDIPSDRINTRRTLLTGGSGELTTGLLPPWIALVAAAICQVSALLLALWVDPPAISWLILFTGLAAAIFYTSPPLHLSWRGLGELTTAIVAAVLVPGWAYSLQTGRLSADVLAVGLPLLPFVMGLFVAIATPDYDADRQVGKHTLPVIVGEPRIARLYAALVLPGYGAALVLWPGRVSTATVIAGVISLPLVLWAWAGLRPPFSSRRLALLWMVFRALLVPAVLVIGLNLDLWER